MSPGSPPPKRVAVGGPRAPRAAAAAVLCGCALAMLPGIHSCSTPDLDTHSWGVFQLCLTRVSDTCHAAGAPCSGPAADSSRTVTLSLRADGGAFLMSRPGMEPAEGWQRGGEFEVQARGNARVCGCDTDVVETFRGRFSPVFLQPSPCGAADAGQAGCTDVGDGGPGGEAPDAGRAGGETPSADAGFDLDASYFSLEGTVVDEIVPVPGATGCACGPCRIEYRVVGRR